MKEWTVTLDVFTMESFSGIKAKNKKQAINKAKEMSQYNGNAELTVYEAYEEKLTSPS